MKYLAHRGLWNLKIQKNSIEAIKSALSSGYGLETDIRDYMNRLVISHDVPTIESKELLISDFSLLEDGQLIAWNIKSDGLIPLINSNFSQKLMNHSVFFDMSIPETVMYKKKGMPYLVRLSEYERLNSLFEDSRGVWIDSFHDQWDEIDSVEDVLNTNKIVIFVSPELHGRDQSQLWQLIKKQGLHENENVYLCTDYPVLAKEYFDE
jgi:hypothetical protein